MPKDLPPALTERELEILRLIATGTSNKDIALQLFISANTVKVHLRNIFTKIGVNSRTEAAVYAFRERLSELHAGVSVETAVKEIQPPLGTIFTRKTAYVLGIIVFLAIILLGAFYLLKPKEEVPAIAVTSPIPSPASRWQELADMPTARSGLAVAVYDNLVYAIGGETAEGVSAVMERYDMATDSWVTLAPKPVAVSEVNAAVIDGQIYIPGGRLASGALTDILESYDPDRDQWERHALLPVALCGYALVAFEGKLYVFGGWDGQNYLASVYVYEPDVDTWQLRTPMPTARAYAGAAIAGGKIYLVGGLDGKGTLAINEVYSPQIEGGGSPWTQAQALPLANYDVGTASIADIIFVFGGHATPATLMVFLPQADQWQSVSSPASLTDEGSKLVQLGGFLVLVGGREGQVPSSQNQAYQAIYTAELPLIIHK